MLAKANYAFCVSDRDLLTIVHPNGDCICLDAHGLDQVDPRRTRGLLLADLDNEKTPFLEEEFSIEFKVPASFAQRVIQNSATAYREDEANRLEAKAINREFVEHYFWCRVNPYLACPVTR